MAPMLKNSSMASVIIPWGQSPKLLMCTLHTSLSALTLCSFFLYYPLCFSVLSILQPWRIIFNLPTWQEFSYLLALAQGVWSAWNALAHNLSVGKLPFMLKTHIVILGNLIAHHSSVICFSSMFSQSVLNFNVAFIILHWNC